MATHPTALGKIAVPTPGTAVQIVAAAQPCSKIRFEAPTTNTNKVWIGTAGLIGSSLTAVIAQLPSGATPPAAYEIEASEGGNTLDLRDYWADATTATEGPIVTYWTA